MAEEVDTSIRANNLTRTALHMEAQKSHIENIRHYTTILSGLLVVLITLVKETFPNPVDMFTFIISLISFAFSLVLFVFAMLIGSAVLEDMSDEGISLSNSNPALNWFVFQLLTTFGAVGFILGIVFLIIFAVTNFMG